MSKSSFRRLDFFASEIIFLNVVVTNKSTFTGNEFIMFAMVGTS